MANFMIAHLENGKFEGAQIGGKEAKAGDPGGHLAAGHEKIFAGVGLAFQVEADRQNKSKIENNNDKVYRGQAHQAFGDEDGEKWHHFLSLACP